jgi:saccharopine dehydrogenase-like NADP-dependent oxidoreductase
MASRKILVLLTSDRFAFPLVRYLIAEGKTFGWKTTIGNMFDANSSSGIRSEEFSSVLKFVNLNSFDEADQAIRKSDIVIGLVPDAMLLKIADSCLLHRKTLISPSRLNRQMALKKSLAEENEVLVLMDCGFSPGLDHITAKKAIDNIHSKGGEISAFKTYSGTFIAEHCLDNPWNFKLTEPVTDLINLGKQNNRHLINGRLHHVPYQRLFERGAVVAIREKQNLTAIPEGDSLYCRKIYELSDAGTVIKGKLLKNGVDHIWNLMVSLGLTDSQTKIDLGAEKSFYDFLDSLLPYSGFETLEFKLEKYSGASSEDIEKLKWLGWLQKDWMKEQKELTPAAILQYLLEQKLSPHPADQDYAVMNHQLEYKFRDDHYQFTATLMLEGEDRQNSALAKAIGFTTGAAAKSVLLENIRLKGLHIPVVKEIYDPMLNELDDLGIAFHVEDKKIFPQDVRALV